MLDYQPKISIVVPTYRTPIVFLREMIDSVRAQTYPNWELCIGDGSEGDQELVDTLAEYAAQDERIKYQVLEKNLGIAGNTNGALALATGDYIGLLDHDDVLPPNTLFEVAKALNEDDYDVLYTDEDKVSGDLSEHDDPNFKPDFSPDLLHSHNYITHFFVARKSIVDDIQGFRSEFDGSQDYDFIFRCTERAKKIKHIPKILYHWRIHGNSVAGDPASKMYAYEAGKRAIEEHLKRIGIQGARVEHTSMWGMYHVTYPTAPDPLVSIVIPNKDHIDDLDKCVQSIYATSTYQNFEFIVVENNSTDPATFAYYERMQQEHPNFKVVTLSLIHISKDTGRGVLPKNRLRTFMRPNDSHTPLHPKGAGRSRLKDPSLSLRMTPPSPVMLSPAGAKHLFSRLPGAQKASAPRPTPRAQGGAVSKILRCRSG